MMKLNIGDITAKIPGESKKGIRKYVQVWVFVRLQIILDPNLTLKLLQILNRIKY